MNDDLRFSYRYRWSCHYVPEWSCSFLYKSKTPGLEECRFCLEARQRFITLLDPVTRDHQRTVEELNRVKAENEKLKSEAERDRYNGPG